MIASPKPYTFPFFKKEQVSKDAYTFYFKKTPDFFYVPGQYIRMIFDHLRPDDRGTTRLFTISSSPLALYLTITTRIIQSSFKHALLTLKEKQPMQFFGPMGRFVYSEEERRPLIFLAGGIGITPFHSIMTYVAEKNITHAMTLFVSFTTAEDVVFYDELIKISADHQNIKVVCSVSHPEEASSFWQASARPESPGAIGDAGQVVDTRKSASMTNLETERKWKGETGRISADMIKKYTPEFMNSKFMISGPPSMVGAMEKLTQEMNIPQEQVQIEKFTGY